MTTIEKIDVYPVRLPMKEVFQFASGTAGTMQEGAPHVFVRVTDSDGCHGWGEGRPVIGWSSETFESVATTLKNHLAPALLGMQIDDRWGMHQTFHRVLGRGPSDGQPIARAALDIAVHDCLARSAGKTLRAFLGGSNSRNRFPLSCTLTAHDGETAEKQMESAISEGFLHYNFKAGWSVATDSAVARTIRRMGGPDAFVWADANQGLKPWTMRQTARALEEAGCDLLEQPCASDQISLMRNLRQSVSIPLAVDEATVGTSDFLRYVEEGLVDYLVVKVTRSSGLWPGVQQLAIAQAAGLGFIVSGLTDGFVTKLAAVQLAAAYGNIRPMALNGSQFTDESELFPGKAEIESRGHINLNDKPGIGIEPDLAALEKFKAAICF